MKEVIPYHLCGDIKGHSMTFFFVPSRVIGLSLFVRVDFLKVDFHHSGDVQNVYLTRGMGRRHGGSASQRQRVSESLKSKIKTKQFSVHNIKKFFSFRLFIERRPLSCPFGLSGGVQCHNSETQKGRSW